ncbi:anion transporter [Thermosinus carboxydivorans Nor1]|uniref:Anion transporter n=1 Tax=Thermosinus carboxydivorans Nor1 TaxID=401526 RepID=A1HRC5_9FIRM|nr:DASS family sodium-coupled anion symporter [Thermosinus carboxydivorans]EAX47440.1 anion transporter [Thermosinus carboxydivorans Nor1]
MFSNRFVRLLIPVVLASIFFLVPAPVGLKPTAWKLFGIFIATILGLIVQSLPEAAWLMVTMTAAAVLVVPLKDLLVGFTDSTVWLIVVAIMISVGFKKSGLARRVGLILISKFGKTTLRIGYILGFMDLLLSPSTPTAPARTGGLVYPLAEGVFEACDSSPTKNPRRIGSYITLLLYLMSMTTGSLFMTALGPNLLNVKLAQDTLGVKITWPLWTMAALPGFIGFFLIPYLVYKIYPPELTSLATVRQSAKQELEKLGEVTVKEWLAGAIFILILGLWVTGSVTKIDATLVAFVGIALMLIFGILDWKDLAESKETWASLMWFGAIMGLSTALTKLGFFTWLAAYIKTILPGGLGVYSTLALVALLATIPHYLFASLVGYVASFAPLAYSVIAATDVPRYPAVFLVLFLMVVSSTLTHYGNGVGPILFAKGYNDKKSWWSIGLLVTALHTVIYLTIGLVYWKVVGLWY